MADQGAIGPRPDRKAKGVEKDGFPGPGFAGQNAQSGFKVEVEADDKNHIANRKCRQHDAYQIFSMTRI